MRLNKLVIKGLPQQVHIEDLMDALIVSADLDKFKDTMKDLYNVDVDHDKIEPVKYFAKDLNLVRMLSNDRALQLYVALLPVITTGGIVELPKDKIKSILNHNYKNISHFYRAMSTVVNFMNTNLKGKSVLYSQYADKATFVIINGDTFEEALNSLASSGAQSPRNIDDLRIIFLGRGVDC